MFKSKNNNSQKKDSIENNNSNIKKIQSEKSEEIEEKIKNSGKKYFTKEARQDLDRMMML